MNIFRKLDHVKTRIKNTIYSLNPLIFLFLLNTFILSVGYLGAYFQKKDSYILFLAKFPLLFFYLILGIDIFFYYWNVCKLGLLSRKMPIVYSCFIEITKVSIFYALNSLSLALLSYASTTTYTTSLGLFIQTHPQVPDDIALTLVITLIVIANYVLNLSKRCHIKLMILFSKIYFPECFSDKS